jgi:hypothetical protein
MTNWKEEFLHLQMQYEKYRKESIKWDVEDFIYYDLEGYTMDLEQSEAALQDMINNHDAEDGITWNTVEYYITKYGTKTN